MTPKFSQDENTEKYIETISYDTSEKVNIIASIKSKMPAFKEPQASIKLGEKSWKPDLSIEKTNTKSVCHIHLVQTLNQIWVERMELAKKKGFAIYIAAPQECLFEGETLATLLSLECKILSLKKKKKGNDWEVTDYNSPSCFIAKNQIRISDEQLESAGTSLLDRALKAKKANEKGNRFEDFLILLFSQTSYFEFFECNYNTTTEEVDLVLRSKSSNLQPPSPIVLVSAKNTKESVGAPALSSIYSKMNNRRGMCSLGFLCSSGKIASTVYEHDLRYSQGNKVVVLLDKSEIDKLLSADTNKDEAIKDLITRSALT